MNTIQKIAELEQRVADLQPAHEALIKKINDLVKEMTGLAEKIQSEKPSLRN